jgi:pyrroline-5-carboxylate reductase
MLLARPEVSLDAMADEFARPGSLTLAALQRLREAGALEALHAAWGAARARSREIASATRSPSEPA